MQTGVINLDTNRPIWNVAGLKATAINSSMDVHAQLVRVVNGNLANTDRLPFWPIEGLTLTNAVGNLNTHITVTPGRAVTTIGGNWVATLNTSITKSLTDVWAEGDNVGGRFTGALIANSTYHCFLLYEPSTQKVDVGIDVSPTANNRPAGWVARRIGSFLRDNSAIEGFTQTANYFERKVVSPDINVQPPTEGASYVLRVPSGLSMLAHGVLVSGLSGINAPLAIAAQNPAKTAPVINAVSPVFLNFNATTGSLYSINAADDAISGAALAVTVPTDSTARIYLRRAGTFMANAIHNASFQTFGWTDFNLLRGL